ncbi:MAG: ribosome-associated translation inhibitor RaiA [Clostridia bacterium]|nr:ribosome-associated translation inhibitor RaiA [Clostridia bacterium]
MKTTIVARKMDLTPGMKEYVEKKLTKLDKFFDEDAEAKITMSVEKNRQKIEATIYSHNTIYRVEQITSDMYVTMDKIIDDMERQIRKNKTRLEKRLRKDAFVDAGVYDVPVDEEKEFNIIKTKTFTTKPMSNEEAILQMNLLGHSFFVYKNSETEKNNIVYKRKDGNYGIIEIN